MTSPPPPSTRLRKLTILLSLLLAAIIGWITGQNAYTKFQRHAARSQAAVDLHMLAGASQSFFQTFDRWPITLTELTNNSRALALHSGPLEDPWGRPYIYIPPSTTAPGAIGTLGADGLKFGDPTDGDQSLPITAPPTPRRHDLSLTWRQPPPR